MRERRMVTAGVKAHEGAPIATARDGGSRFGAGALQSDDEMRQVLHAMVEVLQRPLAAKSPLERADAVVILGSPLGRGGKLTPIAEERVRAGAAISERKLAPVVCVTGGSGPRGYFRPGARTESDMMAASLRRMGVPEESLRLERSAMNTRENALRAADLLLAEGRKRVWIVTQPFHMRRALYHFQRAGFEPLGWHIDDSLQYRDPEKFRKWVLREYAAWAALLLMPERAPRIPPLPRPRA